MVLGRWGADQRIFILRVECFWGRSSAQLANHHGVNLRSGLFSRSVDRSWSFQYSKLLKKSPAIPPFISTPLTLRLSRSDLRRVWTTSESKFNNSAGILCGTRGRNVYATYSKGHDHAALVCPLPGRTWSSRRSLLGSWASPSLRSQTRRKKSFAIVTIEELTCVFKKMASVARHSSCRNSS